MCIETQPYTTAGRIVSGFISDTCVKRGYMQPYALLHMLDHVRREIREMCSLYLYAHVPLAPVSG